MRYRSSRRPTGPPRKPPVRLGTMLVVLVLLAFMIPRVRDPRIWAWLASKEGDYQPDPPPAAVVPAAKPSLTTSKPIASKPIASKPVASKPVVQSTEAVQSAHRMAPAPDKVAAQKPEPEIEPLDLDREETDAFADQAEAILDRTLYLQGIEMSPYWRLVRWTLSNTFEGMEHRASRSHVFNDFVQRPSKLRGQLVRLRLNVRRVLPCIVDEKQPKDIPPLYEIWGFTEESQAWLYVVITPELPAGLKVGTSVDEECIVCGYFFKLQGYRPGGAKPNDPKLFAPLMIGRMALAKPLPPPQSDYHLVWWLPLVGGLGLAGLATVWYVAHRQKANRPIASSAGSVALPWQPAETDDSDDGEAHEPWSLHNHDE